MHNKQRPTEAIFFSESNSFYFLKMCCGSSRNIRYRNTPKMPLKSHLIVNNWPIQRHIGISLPPLISMRTPDGILVNAQHPG